MADSTRLELATSAVTGQRSNQLSYGSIGLLYIKKLVSARGNSGDLGASRTHNLFLRTELLYPLSYQTVGILYHGGEKNDIIDVSW